MPELELHRTNNNLWRNRALWFVLLCVWTRLATLQMHHPFFDFDENFPYYLLTYRLEFTPRAVIGTIYDFLKTSCGINWKLFCVLRFAFSIFAYSTATIAVFLALQSIPNRKFAILLGLFAFAMPSVFHPAAIITMFDIYIVFIMLICTLITLKARTALYVFVPPLCALAVLIHENFIFMYLPFLLGLHAWRGELGSLQGRIKAFLTALATLGTFAVLSIHRSHLHTRLDALETLNQSLIQRAAEHGFDSSHCLVTLEMTYWEHIKSVWSHFFLEQYGPYQLAINAISLIILIPAAVIVAKLWLNAWRQIPAEARHRFFCLLLSCFGACGLFIVAHDCIRWMTAIFICHIASLIILYTDRKLSLRCELTHCQCVRWCAVCLFYLCLDPPSAVCFPVADLLAYPIFKLCM
ncbi:MAG: hypothetical protein J6X55_17950 [Victivallales bacterium]|nr:hypothetical protein [Victivallales bacterium]